MWRRSEDAPVLIGLAEDGGANALTWAAGEADDHRRRLRILHAYSADGTYPWGSGSALVAGTLHNAEEVACSAGLSVLADAADEVHSRYPDMVVITTLVRGSAAACLVAASAEAQLLVTGRRDARHAALAALGSTALAVAAHARCPVVVIPPQEFSTSPPGHVLVGVEDSPDCLDAVAFAFAFADAHGVGLTAVHAWWIDPDVLRVVEGQAWAELGKDQPAALDALLAPWRDRYPGVEVTRVLARDRPAQALVAASDSAAVVVVGSRGRGGFAGLLLGSVSRHVMQHAACPVAVVRNGQWPLRATVSVH